jgi:hypothetical protein
MKREPGGKTFGQAWSKQRHLRGVAFLNEGKGRIPRISIVAETRRACVPARSSPSRSIG